MSDPDFHRRIVALQLKYVRSPKTLATPSASVDIAGGIMSEVANHDAVRDLLSVLIDLRQSLDRAYSLVGGNRVDKDSLKYVFLAFEDVRYDFNTEYRSGSRENYRKVVHDASILRIELNKLTSDVRFADVTSRIRFRSMRPRERTRDYSGLFLKENMSVLDAIHAVIEMIGYIERVYPKYGDISEKPDQELTRVLPAQKLAPVQFEIVDGRLSIAKVKPAANEIDKNSINEAKGEICRKGIAIIDQLRRSNCDSRLIESIEYLHGLMESDGGPIQIGISNIGCEAMVSAFKEELPEAVKAMLNSYSVGINMYVGQFPEWGRFVENAALANLDHDEALQISATATRVVSEIKQNPQNFHPEVPATIAYLNSLITTPGKASKRAAFAVMRTLENLVIKSLTYTNLFMQKTLEKTIDGLSSTVSKVVAVSFMTIALSAASGLVPVSTTVSEINWVKSVVEIVEKQLSALTAS